MNILNFLILKFMGFCNFLNLNFTLVLTQYAQAG